MVEVRVLGPPAATVHGQPVTLASRIQQTIVAVLAAHRGIVSRDQLLEAVWGRAAPPTALRTLQAHVSRLRSVLGPDAIRTEGHGWRLSCNPMAMDADRFEELLDKANRSEPAHAVTCLTEALGLWGGRAFGQVESDATVVAERHRLDERRLHAAELLAETHLQMGHHDLAVAQLKALVVSSPLRETAATLLVQALVQLGRVAEAHAVADRVQRHLAGERLVPSAELVAALSAATPLEASTTGAIPHPGGDLIGRQAERQAITDLLKSARLITLLGPGGAGKTRLALQLPMDVGTIPPTTIVRFCDLSSVRTGVDVSQTVARAVGVPSSGPQDRHLLDALNAAPVLLMLDTCEHVLEPVADLVHRLIRGVPGLTVLGTSRQRLGVDGEHVVDIGPLEPKDAATLFLRRVQAQRSTIRLSASAVSGIIGRLDRLPLAIEMAAAQLRTSTTEELLQRLATRPSLSTGSPASSVPRHRNLTEVVTWSSDLLGPRQRRVFDACSVFGGRFTADAAEEIVGADDSERREIETDLNTLVESSLLLAETVGDHTTYRMLDTVRAVADQQLGQRRTRTAVHRAHVRRYADLARQIAVGMSGPAEAHWTAVLDASLADLRLAAERGPSLGLLDLAMSIPAVLFHCAYDRLHGDIARWARRLLDVAEVSGHPYTPAVRAVAATGPLHAGDLDTAIAMGSEAVAESRGLPVGRFGHQVLAVCSVYRWALDRCVAHADMEVELGEAAGDHHAIALGLCIGAIARVYDGKVAQANPLIDRLNALAAAVGSPTLKAYARYTEGESMLVTSPQQAGVLMEHAVELAHTSGARLAEGLALVSATTVRARHGPDDGATRAWFHRAIRLWRGRGDRIHQVTTLRNMVEFLVQSGEMTTAAILAGHLQDRPGSFGDEAGRVAAACRVAAAALGTEAYDVATTRGALMDHAAVVALALRCTAPGSRPETPPT